MAFWRATMCQAWSQVVGMKEGLRPSPCSQGGHKSVWVPRGRSTERNRICWGSLVFSMDRSEQLLGGKNPWAEAWRTWVREPCGSRKKKHSEGEQGRCQGLGADLGADPGWWEVILTWGPTWCNWLSITLVRERTVGSSQMGRKATVRPGAVWWMAEAREEVGGRSRGIQRGRAGRICWCEGAELYHRHPSATNLNSPFGRPCTSIWEVLPVTRLSGAICNSFSSPRPEGREKRGTRSPWFNLGTELTAVLGTTVLHHFRWKNTHTRI